MKITAIKAQVKNPERVSVFVDGKYAFSLSLNGLLAEKIKQGDELDKADVKRLKKISTDGKLQARAVEWVLNRPRSIREFRDYMYRKKADPALFESLTEEFVARKYLDDTKYAQWLVDLRKRAGKSNRAIRSELFKKGIDREVVDEIMNQATDEAERLKMLITKKIKLPRYKNDPQKLKQYLVGQGFSWTDIKEALTIKESED